MSERFWLRDSATGVLPTDLETFVDLRRQSGLKVGLSWGHFYQMTADSVMLDHRPDYGKRFYDGLPSFPNRLEQTGTESDFAVEQTVESLGHLVMYILYGWETGIYNEFRHFQSRGFTKAQLMELVMYGQLNAGIRGLQLVYNAVGRFLPDFSDGPGPAKLPKSWAPDPDAFKSGLDMSTRDLTARDRKNLTDWYEKTIGYVPNTVNFAMTYHPEFYKWHRARWEVIFQTLPKQVMPYIMLRQHMITGFRDALREAVLLGKAWGITKEWIVHGLAVTACYTGFEGLYAAQAAMDDILRDWE